MEGKGEGGEKVVVQHIFSIHISRHNFHYFLLSIVLIKFRFVGEVVVAEFVIC